MGKLKKVKKRKDPCFYGCDSEEVMLDHDEKDGNFIPGFCNICDRKYKFVFGFDTYKQGDVLYYVLSCLDKTKRDTNYDNTFTIILREPDSDDDDDEDDDLGPFVPIDNQIPKMKCLDFFGRYNFEN